jgi:NADH-quinone oxidoreductase subunit I
VIEDIAMKEHNESSGLASLESEAPDGDDWEGEDDESLEPEESSEGRMGLDERLYLVEVARGLAITVWHVVRNLFHPASIETVEWPEKPRPFAVRFRAKHRLNKWDTSHTKCTACMCCATACPAACITIVAGEYSALLTKIENGVRKVIEKYPKVYDIDLLKCVYCGFCVEACPCDAIKMDTGNFPHAAYSRGDFLWQNRFEDGLPVLEKQAVES